MKCPFLANMEKTKAMNPIVDTDIICETCNKSVPAEAVKQANKGMLFSLWNNFLERSANKSFGLF